MAVLSEILALLDKWPQWKRVTGAPSRIDELERRLDALEQKPATTPTAPGRTCPACGEPAMRRTATAPDPMFGDMGAKIETWTCKSCGEVDEVQKLPRA